MMDMQDFAFCHSAWTDSVKKKKVKRKVQGVPQSQTATIQRGRGNRQTKQAQIEQTYEKH